MLLTQAACKTIHSSENSKILMRGRNPPKLVFFGQIPTLQDRFTTFAKSDLRVGTSGLIPPRLNTARSLPNSETF
jgi:hypothetical protein